VLETVFRPLHAFDAAGDTDEVTVTVAGDTEGGTDEVAVAGDMVECEGGGQGSQAEEVVEGEGDGEGEDILAAHGRLLQSGCVCVCVCVWLASRLWSVDWAFAVHDQIAADPLLLSDHYSTSDSTPTTAKSVAK
jgi:hypothetical protein